MPSITQKGQVVIPKDVRDELEWLRPGQDLVVEKRGQEIVIRKRRSIFDHTPPRPRQDVGLSDRETIQVAHEDHVASKFGPQADS